MSLDLKYVDEAVERLGRAPDAVIPVLQSLQDHYGYLPEEALRRVCAITQITPAAIGGVSTFYDMFRHEPSGKHVIHVCHGTACHVGGAERVEDALRRHLRIPEGSDTDADRRFTIEPVACLGCCTLAPVVRIEEETIGYATAEKVPAAIRDFLASRENPVTALPTVSAPASNNGGAEIKVCLDSCCLAKGTDRVFYALQQSLVQNGVNARVKRVGCVGACYQTPMVEVAMPGKPSVTYAGLSLPQTDELVKKHFGARRLGRRVSQLWARIVDGLLVEDGPAAPDIGRFTVSRNGADERAFFDRQVHIAMEHYGRLDPLDLNEYLAHDGLAALARCLGVPRPEPSTPARPDLVPLSPEEIITTMERSGLRGRGGAGFPTGQKWRMVRKQTDPTKYVICNGDEGDPGAFMDRMILESFP